MKYQRDFTEEESMRLGTEDKIGLAIGSVVYAGSGEGHAKSVNGSKMGAAPRQEKERSKNRGKNSNFGESSHLWQAFPW